MAEWIVSVPIVGRMTVYVEAETEAEERRLAAFYAEFIDGQVPLGPEFEAVWDANARNLYES